MTDAVVFTNNASSRLGMPIPAASITITVETGTGVRFPTPGVDEFFPVIVKDERTEQFEIMYCTQRINDILTVDRAQEGTTAQDWLLGASVWSTLTAGVLTTYFNYSYSVDDADTRFVHRVGDTMTGALSLPGAPTLPNHAATMAWVEGLITGAVGMTDAPVDGNPYIRQSAAWILGVRRSDYLVDQAAIAAAFASDDGDITALQNAVALRITDAPVDANAYVRSGAAWVIGILKSTYDAFVTATNNALALKAPLASPPLTGVPTAPTAAPGVSTTQLATTDFVTTAGNLKANLASPTFTGDPKAPTPATSDSDTSVATTAFAQAAIDAKAVRYDAGQALSLVQKTQARGNIDGKTVPKMISIDTTLTVADRGSWVLVLAPLVLTLPLNTAVGADFFFDFQTAGGAMTLAPNGGAVVDGANVIISLVIPDNTVGTLWCDGTNWHIVRWQPSTAQVLNRVVNGAMQVSQENGDTAGTTNNYYAADQWFAAFVRSAGVTTTQRVQSITPNGSSDRIRITNTSADASLAAGEFLTFIQYIEGNQVSEFKWGTAGARQAILRFGFKGPAGTYSASIRNGGNTRSRVFNFTITAGQANTDTEQVIVIPGDVSGTWPTDETAGLAVNITVACGTTFQTTAGAWQAGNFLGTAANSNGMLTAGSVFELFDVGLYLDPDATGIPPEWQQPDAAQNMRFCQRYFINDIFVQFSGNVTSASVYYAASHIGFMRVLPVLTSVAANASLFPATVGTLTTQPSVGVNTSSISVRENRTANATGSGGHFSSFITASARM